MEDEADERQLTLLSTVEYLLAQGLLTQGDIVNTSLSVTDVSRRNRNFLASREHGSSYLLKQGSDPEKRASIAVEANIYRFLRSEGESHNTSRFLPPYYLYDAEQHILCLGYLQHGESLARIRPIRIRFSKRVAIEMARVLTSLHTISIDQAKGTTRQTPQKQSQWVLAIARPFTWSLPHLSVANISLVKLVQQFEQFSSALESLREQWQHRCLIHGDLKWENWLADQQERARFLQLYLIDWELAGLGDPCWDVGSVFNDYLSFWLLSIPVTGEDTAERMLELARYPLDSMQPAMRAFWYTYAREMKLGGAEAEEWLLRSVRYAAARLVQTAFEQTQDASRLTGNVICMLQVSLNMLKRPADAARYLLGIPVEAAGSAGAA